MTSDEKYQGGEPRARGMDRRHFLKLGGLAGMGVAAAASAAARAGEKKHGLGPAPERFFSAPPIEKVRIGFVGVGGMGPAHVRNLLKIAKLEGWCEIAALCDIDEGNLNRNLAAVEKAGFPRPKAYGRSERDFERMCETEDLDLGFIPVDSAHSPVRRANFRVEMARLGQMTNYERLVMEVWTNGTIRPDDAVAFSAKLLIDHLRHFINFEEEPEDIEEEEVDHESERIKALLKMNVEELELSVRSSNCLKAAGIQLLKDLVQKTESEMLKYRNFGRKSLSELSGILGELGLSFGMDVMPYLGEKKKQEEPEEKECA